MRADFTSIFQSKNLRGIYYTCISSIYFSTLLTSFLYFFLYQFPIELSAFLTIWVVDLFALMKEMSFFLFCSLHILFYLFAMNYIIAISVLSFKLLKVALRILIQSLSHFCFLSVVNMQTVSSVVQKDIYYGYKNIFCILPW